MGCINSTPRPPRPAPLPFDGGAPELILTKRGSPLQITLENWQQLKQGEAVPLHLASHPGYAIVPRAPEQGPVHIGPPCGGDDWMYVELGVGPSDKALKAAFDKQGFFTSSHAPNSMRGDSASAPPSMVFDISWWKYEEGNTVNLVGEARSNERSRDTGGGAQCVDVRRGGGPPGPQLRAVRASHTRFSPRPRRVPQDRAAPHQRVGDQLSALGARRGQERDVREVGGRVHSVNAPVLTQFCPGRTLRQARRRVRRHAVGGINFDNGSNKEGGNKARKFMVNPNGTLSPVASPHLVLGVRDGKSPVPAKA